MSVDAPAGALDIEDRGPRPRRLPGPRQLVAQVRRRLERLAAWRRVIFFVNDPNISPTIGAGRLQEASPPVMRHWSGAYAEFPWTLAEAERRTSEGHGLSAWVVDGVPVCFGWISERRSFRVGEAGGTCSLDAPVLWIWDCVTPPRWRGRGFYTDFLRALQAACVERPLLIYCDGRNEPSRRGILRSGFRVWATITRSRITTKLEYHLPHDRKMTFLRDGLQG